VGSAPESVFGSAATLERRSPRLGALRG